MTRRYLRSLKYFAAAVFSVQLFGNVALANDFNDVAVYNGLSHTNSHMVSQDKPRYSDRIYGLTLSEEAYAKEAYEKLYTLMIYLSNHHVSSPSLDDLLKHVSYEGFLSSLDSRKDYSIDDIYDEVRHEINHILKKIDPHARFLNAREKRDFLDHVKGQKQQVGIQTVFTRRGLKVTEVIAGSAAERAGLKEGDLIRRINGERVSRLGIEKTREIFEKESAFVFQISSDRFLLNDLVEVVKESEKVKTVHSYVLNNSFAYITIDYFSKGTGAEFKTGLIQNIEASGADIKGLIIDLRYNGGGSKASVIEIADDLTKQQVLFRTSGAKHAVYEGDANNQLTDLPLVVLTNNFSASAAELLAGILKDYKRAVVIGDGATYGKATIQRYFSFSFQHHHDTGLVYSNAHVELPISGSYQYHGIQPDILVARTAEAQKVYDGFEGPRNAREYPFYIGHPAPYKQGDPAYSCDSGQEKELVEIYNILNATYEDSFDTKEELPVLCAIDYLSDEPKYTSIKPI